MRGARDQGIMENGQSLGLSVVTIRILWKVVGSPGLEPGTKGL